MFDRGQDCLWSVIAPKTYVILLKILRVDARSAQPYNGIECEHEYLMVTLYFFLIFSMHGSRGGGGTEGPNTFLPGKSQVGISYLRHTVTDPLKTLLTCTDPENSVGVGVGEGSE